MPVDLLQIGATCTALISIFGLWKAVVTPFKKAMAKNEEAMDALKEAIKEFAFELKDSQRDRDGIHKILDLHETRIGRNEDNIIINNERIATLFKQQKGTCKHE
ncbi:hypothetical protein [Streptococcus dysgalactiae]